MGKMKKRTISTLKAIFGSKKGKRHHSSKSSRSVTPDPPGVNSPSSVESFRPIPRTPPPAPARVGPPPSPPVPTRPVAPVAPEPPGPVRLVPCAVCGRTFVPESLSKHVKICEKTAVKKRKTFDSSRQRREGTDLEQYLPKNFGLPENSPFLEKSPPNTAKVAPKPKPQSVRTTVMKPSADLQKCPHCNRAFGVRAFERHVEWCADKAKILPAAPAQPPQHIADAKQRLNARTQYKAPLVRGRRSSQTRDKSSNSRSASVESSRGVSPPPPREYGDGRRRARASESMSSNDCNDEPSPHVPVIKNPRNSLNNSSGDANVRARQARLARDLSSSRNTKEPIPTKPQQEITETNLKQRQDKIKQRQNTKKEQQLKKLEEIATKYNERQTKAAEEKEKKRQDKRQIPVLKKAVKNKVQPKEEMADPIEKAEPVKIKPKPVTKPNTSKAKPTLPKETSQQDKNIKEKNTKNKAKKDTILLPKENSISVDSLDNCVTVVGNNKVCQTIGINTELFCVPCVIHDNVETKRPLSNNRNKASQVENTKSSARKTKGIVIDNEKLEVLYKNTTIDSPCDIEATTSSVSNFSKSDKYMSDTSKDTCQLNINEAIESDNSSSNKLTYSKSEPLDPHELEGDHNIGGGLDISGNHFEDSFEHNTSGDQFDHADENKYEEGNNDENNETGRRHGSSDTYTKFTENPADLDEFMNLTDKMISSQNADELDLEKHINNLHTPKTISLETINDKMVEDTEKKKEFSDTLEDLKLDLKELLQGSGNTVEQNKTSSAKHTEENGVKESKEISDMEHITVYGIKYYEQQTRKKNTKTDDESKLKLPSISVTNKPEPKVACTKKRVQKIFKSNRKYIMLRDQSRDNADNRTFIVAEDDQDSDDQSVSTDAPPLKLPRIESARLDEGYDPFVSAARQMKELLSSDTDIPKKMHNSSKDLTRTLPILRPAKDKAPLTQHRTENSKMIKDTLNKTYQKTPTLQRMKSFGSTNNDNNTSSFGGRCSSFRLNRNDKKPTPKINTTFTKSSKENISMADKTNFNRNSSLNRSFSSYTTSSYSTPKPKDKIPKIATSMYHSFQRTTIKQPVKLDKIKKDESEKKNFVNLDSILADDNSSMTDSNYIDPRLINENDNLPINVNTILNNPDIISSMESLLTTENLPSKFDSFSRTHNHNYELNGNVDSQTKAEKDKANNNTDTNKLINAPVDTLTAQYDKIMSSLEESIASKTIARDQESVFEEFDLEEFMTTFDEEIHKRKSENKRTCSSTTRVVRQCELNGSNRTSAFSSVCSTPKAINPISNGLTPVTNPKSFNFSSNNIVSESLFPSSVKRSTSLLDSIHKKTAQRTESGSTRHKSDQLEQDIMQSLKDFDKFYESEKSQINQSNKDIMAYNMQVHNGEKERSKTQRKNSKSENGNYTPNGKSSNDSAYSSLNRISPSKLTVCPKELNGPTSLERIPAGSESSGSHKDDARSVSSEEFLAMERSAELDEPILPDRHTPYKELDNHEKRAQSHASSRRGSWRPRALSSSSSELSLHAPAAAATAAATAGPRLSRFCHECGSRFPDAAKFCIECGVKRLAV